MLNASLLLRRGLFLRTFPKRNTSSLAVPTPPRTDGDDHLEAAGPSPPHGFELQHIVGSGRFTLTGRAPTGDQVIVEAVVPNRQLLVPFGAEGVTAEPSRKPQSKTPRRRRVGPQQPQNVGARVPFNVFLIPPADGAFTRAPPLDILASCTAGFVSIDGACILRESPEVAGTNIASLDALRRAYRGPLLHQRHLAELIVGLDDAAPSPMNEPRQASKFLYQYWMSHGNNSTTRFGHLPVHTCPPRLYAALHAFCEERCIDDELARFVQLHAIEVQRVERQLWEQSISEALGLRRSTGSSPQRLLN